MRVSIRAMSFRNVRKRAGFSSCALACCRRRENISWRKSRPLAANSTNVTAFLRKGSDLTIDGQPYKIVDITSSEVVLSEDSNDKRYTITKFLAP